MSVEAAPDSRPKPITFRLGAEIAFMTLLTLARVTTLLGAAAMLVVWSLTWDGVWLRASLLSAFGYIASTGLFAVTATITRLNGRS